MKDGVYLPKNGLPPAACLGNTCFKEIHCFFHISPYNSTTDTYQALPCWHSMVDILLKQLQFISQQYRVPGSNDTIDEAMVLFTDRSIHITKMRNKPISQGYQGSVWQRRAMSRRSTHY